MTDADLDDSLIGPLSESRIDRSPVRWGVESDLILADAGTEAYVRREVERYRLGAILVLKDELRSLINALSARSQPNGVLHGIIMWGPASVPKVAGYLGRTVSDVKAQVKALEFLGILRVTDDLEFGDVVYAVDPAADFLFE